MAEQPGAVTFQGNPLTLVGLAPPVGQPAPDFSVLANDLSEVTLSSGAGKVRVLSVVPSLDTPVCDQQTRRFNEEASALGEAVAVWTISADLPFAQARWCGAAGVDRVTTLSDHRDVAFGQAYGVLIKELRLLTRAIFVVDAAGVLTYKEIVPEITDAVNFEAALEATKSLV